MIRPIVLMRKLLLRPTQECLAPVLEPKLSVHLALGFQTHVLASVWVWNGWAETELSSLRY